MGTVLPSIPAQRYFTIGEVADLCGGVRQVAQTYGAFEDFRGCVKR